MTDVPSYRKILLSRMKFIGDVVLTTPVIRSVRAAFPDAYIAYLGDAGAVSLLEHNPNLDAIIPFNFSRAAIVEQPRVIAALRRERFDLAIDLFGNPRSALLTYFSGATTRVGPARQNRGKLYTIQVRDDGKPKTAIEFHNQYIRAAGIEPTSGMTEVHLTEQEKREAASFLSTIIPEYNPLDKATPLIGIHPGATWPAKRWPPERFAELATAITDRFGARVLLTAGPNDVDVIESVMRSGRQQIPVARNLPLRSLAALLSHCSAYVANDNGTMHIAAAVGTPTVGIFGPGEENIWFPYAHSEGNTAVRRDVPCHPCHLDFCNRQGDEFMQCMKLIHVHDILSAIQHALGVRRLH